MSQSDPSGRPAVVRPPRDLRHDVPKREVSNPLDVRTTDGSLR
ncbi:hypothetical protein [Streptomyces sp. NPDC049040]